MLVFDSLDNLPEFSNSAVTIGNFDGVHLGHKFVIETLTGEAKNRSLQSTLVTFDTHPRLFFNPENQLQLLSELPQKIELLSHFSIDNLIILPFRQVASWTADVFLEFLVNRVRMKLLIVGKDFKFGKNRVGDEGFLKSMLVKYTFELKLLPKFDFGGEVVSSSLIRNYIKEGKNIEARRLLGR